MSHNVRIGQQEYSLLRFMPKYHGVIHFDSKPNIGYLGIEGAEGKGGS